MKCMEDEDVQQDSFTRTHRQLLETTADDVDDANLLREMRMRGLDFYRSINLMRLIFDDCILCFHPTI